MNNFKCFIEIEDKLNSTSRVEMMAEFFPVWGR